jgi:hypothetical protein
VRFARLRQRVCPPGAERWDVLLALLLWAIMLACALLAGCGPVTGPPVNHFQVFVTNRTDHPVTVTVRESPVENAVAVSTAQTIAAHAVARFEFGTVPADTLEFYEPAGALLYPWAVFTFPGGPCPFWAWNVDYPSGQAYGGESVSGR